MEKGTWKVKTGLAQMLKGGVIMDVVTPEQAKPLIAAGKPIYWASGNLHSGETGSAEMQMELAYRLIVGETPFIQNIRNNVIVLITPVLEVDGREKQVDTFYYRKTTKKQAPPMVYWGKYVAHDATATAWARR
jgi:hypothetical protein